MQYWGFDEIPIELLNFIDKNPEDSLNYLYTQKDDLRIQGALKDLLKILIPRNIKKKKKTAKKKSYLLFFL